MSATKAAGTSPLYVDIHVLQTLPPANINRDDAGSPKHATYGGVRRARVSSQAWKRAARLHFQGQDGLSEQSLGVRTLRVPRLLRDQLAEAGVPADTADRIAVAAREAWGIKPRGRAKGTVDLETIYLLFLGRAQVEAMRDLITANLDQLARTSQKDLPGALDELGVSKIMSSGHPIDVALFGRMIADRAELNVDAATQVAHAISTHRVDVEFDYFTAVDDENLADETGAGMIGTVEFNAATLYRYANVGFHQLAANLGGDTDAALDALQRYLQAFVLSIPSGHQNSFGHRTAPDLVTLVVRADQPVNLVPAFETPVIAGARGGVVAESIRCLDQELALTAGTWGLRPLHVASSYRTADGPLPVLGSSMPLEQALTATVAAVRKATSAPA